MTRHQYRAGSSSSSSSTSLRQDSRLMSPALVDGVLGNGSGDGSRDYYYRNSNSNSNRNHPDDYLLEDGSGNRRVRDTCPFVYESDDVLTPPASPLPTSSSLSPSPRVLAPDLLRGLLTTLQAIDHAAIFSNAYSPGLAIVSETASTRFTNRWSDSDAYTARLLTHLCAPGFLFLLGMGVVYFGQGRMRLGWSTGRVARCFFVRALVFVGVNAVIDFVVMRRSLVPVANAILLALAFNYFLVGLVWLGMDWTEPRFAELIARVMSDSSRDSEDRLLLHTRSSSSTTAAIVPPSIRARSSQLSFHAHNVFLLVLSLITIWWNIWFDPHHGRCPSPSSSTTLDPEPEPPLTNPFVRFLFYPVLDEYTLGGYPPLAWLSPALLGLLYGRIVLARQWKPRHINIANLSTGLVMIVLFILTRLYHFGNLDESCLAMPEHLVHPDRNQYLASPRSFFNITKYPPSPSFLFFTMGCNFLLLSIFGTVPARLVGFFPLSTLLVFGTSALFFFAVHLAFYKALGLLLRQLFGHKLDWEDRTRPGRKAWGIEMGVLFWADWIVGLAVLRPLCRWYGRLKAEKGVDSIWRFF